MHDAQEIPQNRVPNHFLSQRITRVLPPQFSGISDTDHTTSTTTWYLNPNLTIFILQTTLTMLVSALVVSKFDTHLKSSSVAYLNSQYPMNRNGAACLPHPSNVTQPSTRTTTDTQVYPAAPIPPAIPQGLYTPIMTSLGLVNVPSNLHTYLQTLSHK